MIKTGIKLCGLKLGTHTCDICILLPINSLASFEGSKRNSSGSVILISESNTKYIFIITLCYFLVFNYYIYLLAVQQGKWYAYWINFLKNFHYLNNIVHNNYFWYSMLKHHFVHHYNISYTIVPSFPSAPKLPLVRY